MNPRTALAALGTGIAVFLVVAVAAIEALPFEFSALVGLPVGVLAGGVAVAAVARRYEALAERSRVAVDAVAGFGVGVVAALAASYVNLAGLRSALSVDVVLVIGLAGAGLAAVASWQTK